MTQAAQHPGAIVLGMHRSGTSVVSGLLDALGLDPGPRHLMFDADQFNSDGYWEQRPLVELDDRLLSMRGGFASAPPDPSDRADPTHVHAVGPAITDIMNAFDGPWFMKDPRQCLVLDVWNEFLDDRHMAVVVNRDPRDVIRSLTHRNGYSKDLAAGLWERYARAMLAGLGTRRCHVVQYDRLLADPVGVTTALAESVATPLGVSGADERIEQAASLVRPKGTASSSSATDRVDRISSEQDALAEFLASLNGTYDRIDTSELSTPSTIGHSALRWRRRKLSVASRLIGSNADRRARLDRR